MSQYGIREVRGGRARHHLAGGGERRPGIVIIIIITIMIYIYIYRERERCMHAWQCNVM